MKFYLPDFGTPSSSVPKPQPGKVLFMEAYRDWNALQDHLNGKYFTAFKEKYGRLFVQAESETSDAPNPYILFEFLDRIGGFDNSLRQDTKVS